MDISRCHMKYSIANGYRSFRLQSCFNTSLFSRGVNCPTWLKEQIIFTQNVCLVYVQTRLNKIFVQFHYFSMYQNNFVSKWPVSLQTPSSIFFPKISTVQLKRLCHGCLVHFVTYTSLNAMELMCKWQNHSFMSRECLSGSASNVTNKAHELWKNVRLTSFQNTVHFCFNLQICPSVPPFVFCCVIYTFYSCPEQLFHVSLSLVAVPIRIW